MTEPREERLSWVTDDPALSGRLESLWPEWNSAGDSGLAAMLDQEWLSWDGWSADDKRSRLAELLDKWYPPEPGPAEPAGPGGGRGAPADRIAWIRDDPELLDRLNAVWPGWDDPGSSGLAATLDQYPEWDRWDEWSIDDKRSYLKQTLDEWYPPASVQAEPAAGVPAAESSAAEPSEAQPSDVESPDEAVAQELNEALAAVLAQALETVPEAASLPPERIAELINEVLADELGAPNG